MLRITMMVWACLLVTDLAVAASQAKYPTVEQMKRFERAVRSAKTVRCRDLTEQQKKQFFIIKSRDKFEREMCMLLKR